jgi:hypothetical protein
MHNFFQDWRRRIGCIALMMACVFATGWVRSLIAFDVIKIPIVGERYFHWYSGDGKFCGDVVSDSAQLTAPTWEMRAIGASVPATSWAPSSMPIYFYYWSKVIPLTLLSLYLLLFKQRPVKLKPPPLKRTIASDPYQQYLETGWLFLLAFDSRKTRSTDSTRSEQA